MQLEIFDTKLSALEIDNLGQLEERIERGFKTFMDVGEALMEIRDTRLYRQDYRTFEDYCRDRWGMSRQRAHQLIDAAGVALNLSTIVDIVPATESQARPLAYLEPEQQREAWARAVETAPDSGITAAHVQSVVDEYREKRPVSYHISDDSYEWYTPPEYIDAARGVMGSIDLDPATSIDANILIQAPKIYTADDNGLDFIWRGNVWLNPPYNMPLIQQFIRKAIEEYNSQSVSQAIILTNNSTDTEWMQSLLKYPVCFTNGRIKFYNKQDTLATRQGQAITYLGNNQNLFARVFSVFGTVMMPYDYK